jgi:hypothetical protein
MISLNLWMTTHEIKSIPKPCLIMPAMVFKEKNLLDTGTSALLLAEPPAECQGNHLAASFLEYAAIVAGDVTHLVSDDIVCSEMPLRRHLDQRNHTVLLGQFCLHKKGHGQGKTQNCSEDCSVIYMHI